MAGVYRINIKKEVRKKIAERQDNRCANKPGKNLQRLEGYVCSLWLKKGDEQGKFDEAGYQIDHIDEFCLSQNNDDENLQALCLSCHSVKTKRFNKILNKKKKNKTKKEKISIKKKDNTVEIYSCFKYLDKGYIKYDKNKVRIIFDIDGNCWFNSQDILRTLGYSDLKKTTKRLVNESNRIFLRDIEHDNDVTGIHPQSVYITEDGIHKLIMRSNLPDAHKYQKFLIDIVLPSVRKYEYYKNKQEYDEKINSLKDKIKYLKDEKIHTREEYETAGIVYVVDYSSNYDKIYKIETTCNKNKINKINETLMYSNKQVVLVEESDSLPMLFSYLKLMVYDYTYYHNNELQKDFYQCSLKKIKSSIKECVEILERKYDMSESSDEYDHITDYNNFVNDKIDDYKNKICDFKKKSSDNQIIINTK